MGTKKNTVFITKVTDNDEYFNEVASAAVIEITPKLWQLIKKGQRIIKDVKKDSIGQFVYDIRFYETTPIFLNDEQRDSVLSKEQLEGIRDKEEDYIEGASALEGAKKIEETVDTETVMLHVTAYAFYWSGYYENTQVKFETGSIMINQI